MRAVERVSLYSMLRNQDISAIEFVDEAASMMEDVCDGNAAVRAAHAALDLMVWAKFLKVEREGGAQEKVIHWM